MEKIFHSVSLDDSFCNGCSECLKKCPTEAIRIKNGKAVIIDERCIDCGECMRVCRFHAKNVQIDPLADLKNYKFNIALPSIAIYGQFPNDHNIDDVFQTFLELGFDKVYDVAYAADILTLNQLHKIRKGGMEKPIISTYCPAIVRLIQMKFPSLIDNLVRLETPFEVAARIVRKKVRDEKGLSDEEIGVFYIAECPATSTAIKNMKGNEKSSVNGLISIETIYSRLLKNYKVHKEVAPIQKATGRGIGWGSVGGQGHGMGLENYLAVDGIEEVVKVLEKIDLGKHSEIDFFEGYACICGCVGGPLNVENPFIAKNKITRMSAKLLDRLIEDRDAYTDDMLELKDDIQPNLVLKLDTDMRKAIEKMSKMESIYSNLPKINCGACGAPSCMALAEDIVLGKADISMCVVL